MIAYKDYNDSEQYPTYYSLTESGQPTLDGQLILDRQRRREEYIKENKPIWRVTGQQHRYLRESMHISHYELAKYGGAVGALKNARATELVLSEQELTILVQKWRSANPNIVKLWRAVEEKLKLTICYHVRTKTNTIEFRYQDNMLFITLPSGRELCYRNPRIELGKFGQGVITYDDNKLGSVE